MTGWEGFILGVVQGLTEFLPVSSSGHLVIFQALFGIEGEGGLVFEVAVHVATLAAILVVYRERVLELVDGVWRRERESLGYAGKLAVATLPAVVVALTLKESIEGIFASPAVAGVCLLVSAGIVASTRWTLGRAMLPSPGWGAAFVIGCAQAFAILPGISRSGTTLAVALALGVAPAAGAEFSFLLGAIAMAGAAVLILPEMSGTSFELLPIGLGMGAALVSGIAAIALFLRLLERRNFYVFAYYLIPAGAAFLAWLAVRS